MKNDLELQLLIATANGEIDKVKGLLEKGVDVNFKNEFDWSPVMVSSMNGYTDIVDLLLENGANIDVKDPYGQTALKIASYYGREKVVKILEEHKQAKEKIKFIQGL